MNSPPWKAARSWFLGIACFFFAITAIAKFVSVGGDTKLLSSPDPVFVFMANKHMLFLAGIVEFGVVCFICAWKTSNASMLAVAWISSLFLAYRVAVWISGYRGPCSCWGDVWNNIGATAAQVDLCAKIALGALLAGSYGFLLQVIWSKRNRSPAAIKLPENHPA